MNINHNTDEHDISYKSDAENVRVKKISIRKVAITVAVLILLLLILFIIGISGKSAGNLEVGDYIVFGNYTWQVLAIKGSDALVISERIIDLITDVITGTKKIYISGHAVPAAVAKERFMRLDCDSVASVTEKLSRQPKIKNPDLYILTMLYNAASTSGIAALAGSKASNKPEPSFDLTLIMEHAKNSKPML